MKNLTYIISLWLSYFGAVGQNNSLTDSLKNMLTQPMADTSKVLILDQLGRSLMYSQPVEAMKYAQEGLKLASQSNYNKGKARVLNRIGSILRISGNYTKSLESHLASIKVAQESQDRDALARTYNNIGILYSEQKNHVQAIEYYQKTRKLAEELKDDNLKNIALANIGMDYSFLNQLDSALFYTQIAYQMSKEGKGGDLNVNLVNLGNIYKRMGKDEIALRYYKNSIPKSITAENHRALSQTYLDIAEIFRKLNRSDSTIFYAQNALQLAQDANIIPTVVNASYLLSSVYESINKARAFDYLKMAWVAKDSILSIDKVKNFQKVEFNEQLRQQEIKQAEQAYQNRVKVYVMASVLVVFFVVLLLLYRNIRLKQKANALLQHQRDEINLQRNKAEEALTQLRSTQSQLIQKEKLASLGELTAGIAHEIQNPLNFVNNFSELSVDLVSELLEERNKVYGERDEELEKDLLNDLAQNQEKINHHGKRASSIVKGMLEHSRQSTGARELTDINQLADEYLRLSYHGLRAKDKDGLESRFNADYELIVDEKLPKVEVVPQEIGRVLLNLINNAFYAVNQRVKHGELNYQPKVTILTQVADNHIIVKVKDNGIGMPEATKSKIFQPFFTTKPTGEGTGLGLSLAYDIVTKGHGGTIECESVEGEGTTFRVELPIKQQ